MDYAYSFGIKYSYALELRNENGTIIPPSEIQLSFEEVWNGYIAMIAEIEEMEGF